MPSWRSTSAAEAGVRCARSWPASESGRYAPGDHRAVDGHEPRMRSGGGSITDPDRILAACRESHDWLHSHPLEAEALGLIQR
jgi:hypothetical protein